jgi:hypothetical protein
MKKLNEKRRFSALFVSLPSDAESSKEAANDHPRGNTRGNNS